MLEREEATGRLPKDEAPDVFHNLFTEQQQFMSQRESHNGPVSEATALSAETRS